MKSLLKDLTLTSLGAFCALLLVGMAGGLTACQSGTTLSSVTSQITPTTLAKGAQDVLAAGGAAILAKNPAYVTEVAAAADVFTAIAASNPASLTSADVSAALKPTSISPANQTAIATYAGAALALYTSDFSISFPKLKPDYALFATAIANGLNVAAGFPAKVVPLPVTAPTPTPTPTA